MKKVRVLHIDTEKSWRGGERQVYFLAEGLRTLETESEVVCLAGHPLHRRLSTAGHLCLPVKRWLLPWKPLIRAAGDSDVIHAHTSRGHNLGLTLKVLSGKPLLVTRRVDFKPGNNPLTRWKYRSADRVACISGEVARVLVTWGLSPQKTVIIPSAAAPLGEVEDGEKIRIREELGIDAERPLVGTVGALVGHKDQRTFIEAARGVHGKGPEVAFVVVGSGPLEAELRALAAELGMEGRIFFTGFREDADRILASLDVFALPSRMEGLGTVVLDAFSLGVPVAATRAGGIPEMVRDGETGLLSPPGDPEGLSGNIIRLLEDQALARRLTDAALRLVRENHSVDLMAERYRELYREMVKGAKKEGGTAG
jgi:glycosyltransferase involved in cell wall biosynthesis